jgi:hypothetical protein
MDRWEIKIVEEMQCEIPTTNEKNYITGIYALNLPDETGYTADWHDVFHWRLGVEKPRKIKIAGIDTKDTNFIYSNYGIFEGKESLLKIRLTVERPYVYVANHCRAVLDMVYDCLNKYNAIYNLTGALDDWFDRDEDKLKVIEKCSIMKNFLDDRKASVLENWLKKEIDNCETICK